MQRNPHSYQIATGYRTFYSLSLIYQPITKKRLFFYNKTAFFAGQNAKTRHKNTPSMADKHPRIHGKALHRPGSAPLPHSGLRGAYTRVLSGYPSLFGQKKSLS